MNSRTRFQLSIAGLTVLLIAGLSGTFIMGVLLSLEGFQVSYFIIALVSLGLGIGALRQMLRVNKKEIAARTDAAVNEYHEFIDKWSVSAEQWTGFVEKRLIHDRKESNGYGYVVAGLLTFIVAMSAFSLLSQNEIFVVLPSTLVLGFLLGKWGTLLYARRRFEKDKNLGKAEVHFAEKLIVLNGKLIMLDDFGIRLKSFQLQSFFEMQIIAFKTETGFGNRKSHKTYMIPVPEDKLVATKELVALYQRLIA